MQKEFFTWDFIADSLEKKIAVILLYVIESKGSSPGRQGFLMAVNAAGRLYGSIGGGIMEYKFAELAKAKLKENDLQPLLRHQVHNKLAPQHQSGMICSGEQTIFIYPVLARDLNTIRRLTQSLKACKNGILRLTFSGLSFTEDEIPAQNYLLQGSGADFSLTVKTGYHLELYIIGAGHCSLALSKMMNSLGFYIRLFDDRPLLNTIDQNHYVHEKIHLDDYIDVSKHISGGPGKYVVIMTNGYRSDEKALRALLNESFAYIGLLGSQNKIKELFASCIADGIPAELISKLHAPAGVPIMSQTPEEIAISIAAEIISVKNAPLKT